MADELDSATQVIQNHDGFENDDTGRIIARIYRFLLAARNRIKNLEDRVSAIEARLPPQ